MQCCNTVAMASAVIAASLLLLLSSAQPVSSNPVGSSSSYVPDYELLSLLELLSKLRQTSSIAEDPAMKRGLDLGINRGFSGAQAAKHLMGLAAAQYAAGPGRRRRDLA